MKLRPAAMALILVVRILAQRCEKKVDITETWSWGAGINVGRQK